MNTYQITGSGKMLLALAAVGALTLAAAQTTSATIIQTDSTTTTGYTINTSGDLALGVLPTVSGTGLVATIAYNGNGTGDAGYGGQQPSANPAVLTNGLFGPANPINQKPTPVAGVQNGTIITIALATPTNISQIDTYTAWADTGRDGQNYTVSYSTDGGTNYTVLKTVAYAPAQNDAQVALTSTSGILAAGATSVQFNFENVESNPGVAYTEIAIYAVPEPAPLALLTLAGAGLLLLARRRRPA